MEECVIRSKMSNKVDVHKVNRTIRVYSYNGIPCNDEKK